MSRTSTGPIHSKVEYDRPGGYSSLHMGLLVTGTKDSKPASDMIAIIYNLLCSVIHKCGVNVCEDFDLVKTRSVRFDPSFDIICHFIVFQICLFCQISIVVRSSLYST